MHILSRIVLLPLVVSAYLSQRDKKLRPDSRRSKGLSLRGSTSTEYCDQRPDKFLLDYDQKTNFGLLHKEYNLRLMVKDAVFLRRVLVVDQVNFTVDHNGGKQRSWKWTTYLDLNNISFCTSITGRNSHCCIVRISSNELLGEQRLTQVTDLSQSMDDDVVTRTDGHESSRGGLVYDGHLPEIYARSSVHFRVSRPVMELAKMVVARLPSNAWALHVRTGDVSHMPCVKQNMTFGQFAVSDLLPKRMEQNGCQRGSTIIVFCQACRLPELEQVYRVVYETSFDLWDYYATFGMRFPDSRDNYATFAVGMEVVRIIQTTTGNTASTSRNDGLSNDGARVQLCNASPLNMGGGAYQERQSP